MKACILRFCLLVIGCCCFWDASQAQAANADLVRLQKSYDEAAQRALTPLQATYESELQKLLEQRTRSGNLEAAAEIKAELERLGEQRLKPTTLAGQMDEAALRRKLMKGKFVFYFSPPRSKLFTFNAGGKVGDGSSPQEFKWKLEGKELLIYSEPGQLTHALVYDADTDTFRTGSRPSVWMSRKAYLENAPK